MTSNSEARKRSEERQATKETVDAVQSMDRPELEKVAVLSLKLLAEVQSYCHNIAELAPLAHGTDSDPFNAGVAEGRRRQAVNTLAVINGFLASLREKIQHG